MKIQDSDIRNLIQKPLKHHMYQQLYWIVKTLN